MATIVTAQPVAYPGQQHQQQVFVQPQFQVQQPQVFAPASDWSSGLCDCFDDTASFCDTFWCGICQMGYQYEMLTHGERRMNLPLVAGIIALDALITGGFAAKIMALHLRTEVRRRFNITPGDDCGEACKWFWCTPCSVCQTYREMTTRGMWPAGVCISTPPQPTVPMGHAVSTVDEDEEEFYPTKQ